MWFARNRKRDRERAILLLILAAYALLVFVGVVRWTMMTPASQGRLMFPAISVISLLMWLGWETIFSFRFSTFNWSKLRWAMPVFMLVTAVVVPFRDIAPTYAAPQMIGEQQLPPDLKRLDVDYGDQLRLLGYRQSGQVSQVTAAEFTLYWQCLRSVAADYSVFAIVYGRQLQEVGKRDAYPYHGLYATRQCESGHIFADPYRISIDPQAARPTLIRAQIGLKDWTRQLELAPTSGGQPISSVLVTVSQLPADHSEPQPQIAARYRLGDTIELWGYDAPQIDWERGEIRYRLYWRRLDNGSSLPEDYTVFAHALGANSEQLAQGDSQPFDGDYPTSAWLPGETFVEERSIKLEPGTRPAQVAVGLYRLADGVRLPVIDAQGVRQPDSQIMLAIRP
jgi:hypothetical protein